MRESNARSRDVQVSARSYIDEARQLQERLGYATGLCEDEYERIVSDTESALRHLGAVDHEARAERGESKNGSV